MWSFLRDKKIKRDNELKKRYGLDRYDAFLFLLRLSLIIR